MNAQQIIRKEYGDSRNFMTPTIIRFGMLTPNVAYELSQGEGFTHNPIFGVSIVKYNPETQTTERLIDESKMFDSLSDAEDYIAEYDEN